jgi:hypothetical protein
MGCAVGSLFVFRLPLVTRWRTRTVGDWSFKRVLAIVKAASNAASFARPSPAAGESAVAFM